jgi:hypothetical protein
MKYTYDICAYTNQIGGLPQIVRTETTTNLDEITINNVTEPFFVRVIDNFTDMLHMSLKSPEDLESWRIAQERAAAWVPEKYKVTSQINESNSTKEMVSQKENIKPSHYQNYIEEFEWIDAMSRIPRYKDPIAFKAAIELQIRKYLDRNGRKDAELQELKKGLFYYMYLVTYLKNHCKPILAKDVHAIMETFK